MRQLKKNEEEEEQSVLGRRVLLPKKQHDNDGDDGDGDDGDGGYDGGNDGDVCEESNQLVRNPQVVMVMIMMVIMTEIEVT